MSYLLNELRKKREADSEKPVDKILLMGLQAAGKTAIKDVVFFDKNPEDVTEYMATTHYQRQIVGDEKKSMIIDSGGQESYWNEAVTYFRYLIFSNAKVLIWVVDLSHPELFEESERRFSFTIRQFKKENKDGKIYVFCHKADIIAPDKLNAVVEHVKELLSDPKFEIDFKITTIYKKDELKKLMLQILEEASVNQEQIELVTDVEKKIEESPEFLRFLEEHQADPRVKELMEYIRPQPKQYLPSFGKAEVDVDLERFGIIEILVLDKKTLKPTIGASAQITSDKGQSLEYILALNYFKKILKSKENKIGTYGSTFTYPDGNVHALIFSLRNIYIVITSFSEITPSKKQELYRFIAQFSSTIFEKKPDIEKKKMKLEEIKVPMPQPIPVAEVTVPTSQEQIDKKLETKTEEQVKASVQLVDEKIEVEPRKEDKDTLKELHFTENDIAKMARFLCKLYEEEN